MSLSSKDIFVLSVAAMLAQSLPAQADTYRNAIYGFTVDFPNPFPTCKVTHMGNEHGVSYHLASDTCDQSSVDRDILVTGNYNADDEADAEVGAKSTCDYVIQRAGLKVRPRQAPAGLQVGNLNSASCRVDFPDGRVYIIVDAMAGQRILGRDGDPDAKAPFLDYSVQLNTNAKSLDADLTTLRSVLKSIRFFRGKCCDSSVTGLP